MPNSTTSAFVVRGNNSNASFQLTIWRGEGMCLLAMNWKNGSPPDDFVGFALEFREPDKDRFFSIKNRLSFPGSGSDGKSLSTRLSPIQKFRWVHFPFNAEMDGEFTYRVTPVFMNSSDELSYGEFQEAKVALKRHTYEGQLNVAFTRGFVSSQAFVDNFVSEGTSLTDLIPELARDGLDFTPSHPKTDVALPWMGFEARREILRLLDDAIADESARVKVIAYDLNLPEMVDKLVELGDRVQVIIDDNSQDHGEEGSAENKAEMRLAVSAGAANVKRQHMGQLQHNKTIIVNSDTVKVAVGGSTNFSWRGFYIQANNALFVYGAQAIKPFEDAFDQYWLSDSVSEFGQHGAATWTALGLADVDAQVTFSPHSQNNAVLNWVANDISNHVSSSLLFSIAFLYQTPGAIKNAVIKVTADSTKFVYGMSDKKVGGIEVLKPDGNLAPLSPSALEKNVPVPFKAEIAGGGGVRMHHKFVVIDFDKPTARVYLGSYNFSKAADNTNGENLFLIKDRRVAVAYMVEAIRLFDHYHFRALQRDRTTRTNKLELKKPPRQPGELPWWSDDYTDPRRIKDRLLFSK
ncbi:phospholipase D-like domain-containing protein [Dyadobacter sp. CY261]|uniref:phospholipase D-like domain-containing protein n=1 Tax=Dyadobacter sp. CY261 TaxID=2907203 RepID=UPI001F391DB5|nr:phospholipase D-like domain-containing protein [Dyadobacter sp. CY261]MCF0072890.1 phospholipase D-like domain-containing protein [Dyadobacter sp. CY261]